MVYIDEKIGMLGSRIDFHTVKLFPEQVKGTHPALEKCRLRFAIQPFQQDFRRCFIAATLHDLAVPDCKTHLQIGMGRKDLLQRRLELLRIYTAELPGCRHIVLQTVPMLLPIDIDPQLIFGERVELLAFVGPDLFLPALQQSCPLPDTGCLQNILRLQGKPQLLVNHQRQPNGSNGGKPHGNKICRHAKSFRLKLPGHNPEQLLLWFRFRRHNIRCLQLRHRQCPTIHLAIGCQRQFLQLHIKGGNHIRRQKLRCIFPQLFRIHSFFGGIISTQLLYAAQFLHRGRCTLNSRETCQHAFDLAQLYTEAAELHLLIDASEILQISILCPTHQIPGTIHTLPLNSSEFIRRHLRQVQIAAAHTGPGNIKLTSHPTGQELALAVHDIRLVIRQGAANALRIIIRFHFVHRRKNRAFRRPITIEEAIGRLAQRQELFPAHRHQAQRTVGEGRAELHTNLRGEERNRNPVFFYIVMNALQIQPHRRRNDIDRSPAG